MTHLLCSGLKYLTPQWWEFASYTGAKDEEMNLLKSQSLEDARGSHCCKPHIPRPCSIASCPCKSVTTAAPHTSSAETPQGHFCRDRYKMIMGYKSNVPPNPPPSALLLAPLKTHVISAKTPEGEAYPGYACR